MIVILYIYEYNIRLSAVRARFHKYPRLWDLRDLCVMMLIVNIDGVAVGSICYLRVCVCVPGAKETHSHTHTHTIHPNISTTLSYCVRYNARDNHRVRLYYIQLIRRARRAPLYRCFWSSIPTSRARAQTKNICYRVYTIITRARLTLGITQNKNSYAHGFIVQVLNTRNNMARRARLIEEGYSLREGDPRCSARISRSKVVIRYARAPLRSIVCVSQVERLIYRDIIDERLYVAVVWCGYARVRGMNGIKSRIIIGAGIGFGLIVYIHCILGCKKNNKV